MKLIIRFTIFSLIVLRAYGQPIKIQLPKSDKVVIYADAPFIVAQGYDGDDILISPQPSAADTLLKYPLLTDNSNKGDSVIKYQSQLKSGVNNFVFNEIHIITNCRSIKILVPNRLPLLGFEFKTTSPDGLLQVQNYKGPVQIAAYFSTLKVDGLTGPFFITNEYGKINVDHIFWDEAAKWSLYDYPYLIRSTSSDIQITVPADLKAYFGLFKGKGKVYSKIRLGPGLLMNDGGVGISVKSTTGNIFLNQERNK
jgi:hypothetical protein